MGGFGVFSSQNLKLENSKLSSNKASLGGAIYFDLANTTAPLLKNVTFLVNSASSGGAVFWRTNTDGTIFW
jgi:hypothetical protein